MKNSAGKSIEILQNSLNKKSKHSAYQSIHPSILGLLNKESKIPLGKAESERFEYMKKMYDFSCKNVIDIGANTGYFSFSALAEESSFVQAYEGNTDHANFIKEATVALEKSNTLKVHGDYFDFKKHNEHCDVILCLNVLHHLGDDFGDRLLKINEAKNEISTAIQYLSTQCDALWLQLGFNWKGNKKIPLFEDGTKKQLINFVEYSCDKYWSIESVGIFNPNTRKYENINNELMKRFDEIGEFLNRPIFLLKKI